jgi:proteasome inhibitor subunit 1 (PI31)
VCIHAALSTPSWLEITSDGWNDKEGEYAFRYALESEGGAISSASSLLLKCIAIDGGMFVSLMAGGNIASKPPDSLDLNVVDHAVPEGYAASDLEASLNPQHYRGLQDLVMKIQGALDSQVMTHVA